MRPHGVGPQRTIEAYGEGVGVAHRIPEGRRGLARQRAAGEIGDRARDHHRQSHTLGKKTLFTGKDRRLGVQGVEDRLYQDDVGAAVDQPVDLLAIGEAQVVEGDGAVAGIIDVGRDRRRAVGRTDGTRDEAASTVLALGPDCSAAGDQGAVAVEVVDRIFHLIIGLGDAGG